MKLGEIIDPTDVAVFTTVCVAGLGVYRLGQLAYFYVKPFVTILKKTHDAIEQERYKRETEAKPVIFTLKKCEPTVQSI